MLSLALTLLIFPMRILAEAISNRTEIPGGAGATNRNFTGILSVKHCPRADDAISSCSRPDTNFVYHECCGDMNMVCCQYYQSWVISSLSCLAVLLSIFFLYCLVKCCCGYKNKSQQSYHFESA
ncbi:unnamed protein product [Caenorhabditis angaria]|uniref:Uncharacterized protein n=1 Tax=Caenorhabditis angaria TaxID=860376 RepID=A0A9P1IEL0_9PELO|nr:unnamed protein product [Caenorhabditis angaria]